MGPENLAAIVGPGPGPDGSPVAIAISPVLTGRDSFDDMRSRILEAVPGARLITVSNEGLADESLAEVEVLLRGWALGGEAVDRVVGRSPKLRWIHSVSVGVEGVLTSIVRARGLTVTNGRSVFDKPIAEYVMAMILAICHRLPQLLELQRERSWQPLEAREISSLTIGLVGVGGIGREVARLASAFGPRVIAVKRHHEAGQIDGMTVLGGVEALPELMAQSDFIVLALPLTVETEGVISESLLAQAKRGSWLINVARGALIDELALSRALRDGPLGGAVLDAFRQEPLPDGSALYRMSNCIVTPHTSWSSGAVLGRTLDVFCDNLRRYKAGEPLRFVVDNGAGY